MARRHYLAAISALPLLAALLGGCTVIPTHVVAPVTAGIGKLQLVVPTSAGSSTSVAMMSTLPWNRARLTLSPKDGRTPAVSHVLEDHGEGLALQDDIGALPPGQYNVHVDLVQAMGGGSERVIATGNLDGATAATLAPGLNNLQVMVHPAQAGTHVSLVPSAMMVSRHSGWHASTAVDNATAIGEVAVAVLAGAVVDALDHPSSAPSTPLPSREDQVTDYPSSSEAPSPDDGYSSSSDAGSSDATSGSADDSSPKRVKDL